MPRGATAAPLEATALADARSPRAPRVERPIAQAVTRLPTHSVDVAVGPSRRDLRRIPECKTGWRRSDSQPPQAASRPLPPTIVLGCYARAPLPQAPSIPQTSDRARRAAGRVPRVATSATRQRVARRL